MAIQLVTASEVPEEALDALKTISAHMGLKFGSAEAGTQTDGKKSLNTWTFRATLTGNLIQRAERFLELVDKIQNKMQSRNLTGLDSVSFQTKSKKAGIVLIRISVSTVSVSFARKA